MSFFDKGSFIKHKNLQLTARIIDVTDGRYRLKWATIDDPQDRLSDYALRGTWTASQLIQEFTPIVSESRWDRLIDGSTPLGEDHYAPRSEGDPQQEV